MLKKFLFCSFILFTTCGIFDNDEAICVKSETWAPGWTVVFEKFCYDWDGESEKSCNISDGTYYSDTTCEEYCENKSACYIK